MSMAKRFTFLIASLLVSGLVIAQSQQGIREQLFGETDAVKKQADELHANLLAPASYAEGLKLYNSAGETLAKGKDLDRVREDVGKAKVLFAHSIDASKLAQVSLANAITARTAAQKAESEKYAAKDWTRAEQSIREAAATLEDGNMKKAGDQAIDAEKAFRATEAKAIAARAKGGK
jgi:hypothetical protein